jgi:L-fuconolactonase
LQRLCACSNQQTEHSDFHLIRNRQRKPRKEMRIDSHQHFWRYSPAEHPWMSDEMVQLKRDFLPRDLRPLLESLHFDGCIAVQASQTLKETSWLLELAGKHGFIKGVVGWVNLLSADLPRQLESFAAHAKFVGVRHIVQDEPDDEFMLRAGFLNGISRLRQFDLTYDLLLFPKHLRVAAKLVQKFPGQPFVLDHIAKPMIADGLLSPWREDLKELASSPNVFCKLSGMVTEAAWNRWKPADFSHYIDAVVEAFGADRLMIGSDWPVCTLSADYASTMQIVIDYAEQFPPEARLGILGGNCARFYGIDSCRSQTS